MSSGPDSAVAAVRLAVRAALSDVDPGQHVLVACSGGADSVALADATVFESRRAGWQVGAVVVDHGLQPSSAEVAAAVGARLTELGCDPVEVRAVTVGTAGGPEAAARAARYAVLSELGATYDACVLLGHTLDDQAETVLLGLARGSGVRSLAGMPAVSGRFRRPLLSVRREQTHQACRARSLPTWSDPHNSDAGYARVRVRQRVLPVLEDSLGPGIAEALARTARLARDDADLLDALALTLLEEAVCEQDLDVAVLVQSQPALRRRALRTAAVRAGCPAGDLAAVHVDELERLVVHWHGQGPVALPGGVQARRHGGLVKLETAPVAG